MGKFEYGLGANISPPDRRDYQLSAAMPVSELTFPQDYTIPNLTGKIYDQGQTSMCVAYSLKWIKEWQELQNQKNFLELSEDFIFADRKPYQSNYGLLDTQGMYPREALQNLKDDGVCRKSMFQKEANWWDMVDNFNTDNQKDALNFIVKGYARIYTINEIKAALIQSGAFTMSLKIYSDFIGGYNKTILQNNFGASYLGNHMVTVIGWEINNGIEYLQCINSWGLWGLNGIFYIPTNSYFNEAWALTDMIQGIKYWRIQVGAYSIKLNAEKMQIALKAKGFSTYIVYVFDDRLQKWLYKVQLGAFCIEKNAIDLMVKVKSAGFDCFKIYY